MRSFLIKKFFSTSLYSANFMIIEILHVLFSLHTHHIHTQLNDEFDFESLAVIYSRVMIYYRKVSKKDVKNVREFNYAIVRRHIVHFLGLNRNSLHLRYSFFLRHTL